MFTAALQPSWVDPEVVKTVNTEAHNYAVPFMLRHLLSSTSKNSPHLSVFIGFTRDDKYTVVLLIACINPVRIDQLILVLEKPIIP